MVGIRYLRVGEECDETKFKKLKLFLYLLDPGGPLGGVAGL